MNRPRRKSVLEQQINAGLRRGSIAHQRALSRYSLGPSPDEHAESSSDSEFESLLPEIDLVTNSIFPPKTEQLCFIVLFESFDKKNLCLNSMYSIATESSARLSILMNVSYHPDDYDLAFMEHMRALDDPQLQLVMDECSASETDTGRAMTVAWALSNMFNQTPVTLRLKIVLCCGEDVDYDRAIEMYDYVKSRHPCYLVYGSDELRSVSSSVNYLSKWKLLHLSKRSAVGTLGSLNA
jgi:hypothetical protein